MNGNRRNKQNKSPDIWKRILPYAVISAVSFMVGIVLLGFMFFDAQQLVNLGLVGNFYYIVLLPLGLSAATFLFGILRSHALYKGKIAYGTLELSGAVVVFVLVVIGGFYLPKPPPESFDFTIFVQGEQGFGNIVLSNEGEVLIQLGADIRSEKIGDKGQAEFKNIPAKFRGQEVPITVKAEGFEILNPSAKHSLTGDELIIQVRRKAALVSGNVVDSNGQPISNARIRIGDIETNVTDLGHFIITLSGGRVVPEVEAYITAAGYESLYIRLIPNGGDASIQLHRSQ